MGPVDLSLHLLGFVAPALAVALMVALASRVLMPGRTARRSWWVQFAINTIAGAAVLVAGLWFFGVDGKMATYAVLVVAVATAQWLGSWPASASRKA
jgi:hypothetical protein